jgi:valyl-tRNA synthetase
VWEWKKQYGGRINDQLRRVGASLDWSREVFTMDAPRSAAVTAAFLSLYDDGLIYRRNRLVSWCPHLQTAISDIEVDTVQLEGPAKLTLPSRSGPFVHEFGVLDTFSYPLEDGTGVINVSTTRLETMVGDVAVAVHPDDDRYRHFIGAFLFALMKLRCLTMR